MQQIKPTDQYWSELYDAGRDFTLITIDVLSKILGYTDGALPKTCLDIGCGTGQLTRELYHRGYTCVGADASASAIKIAQSATTVPADRLQYVHFDVEHDAVAALPTQQFSLITCKLVYAFIRDKTTFLERVQELLAPGGFFVVITPHVDDTPAERRGIAVDEVAMGLLATNFDQVARYKGDELGSPLTYFIGVAKA